jgi:transcriptional regulator with PAS, ATPase and Fis domain
VTDEKDLQSDLPPFQEVIDVIDEPFVIIDSNYRIVAANKQYREHYDVPLDQMIGQNCHKISHHSNVPCSQNGEACPLELAIQSGQTTEVMHIHYDAEGKEELVELRAKPIRNHEGVVTYIGESVFPVIEKTTEENLLIGRSPACMRLVSLLQRVAQTPTMVLLEGESGVGKEKVAQYLHHYSKRSQAPFIVVDCGALGENLIESELFGHEKGAFTGAGRLKQGLFEAAQGGSLFIDEIGDLPLELQTKLLRVLETGKIRRLGGTRYFDVDVRIIAATHRDLKNMVQQGSFREDLYYRLAAFPVHVPALRERKDDIPLLAEYFLEHMEEGENSLPLAPDVIQRLLSYDYPGNIRELRNIIERANILAGPDGMISADHVVLDGLAPVSSRSLEQQTAISTSDQQVVLRRRGRVTEQQLLDTLNACGGHRAEAARQLGISERTLYRRIGAMNNELENNT